METKLIGLAAAAALTVGGCMTPHVTDPPRSATEQLLISTAADLAMEQVDAKALAARTTFVDDSNLEGTGKAYVAAAVRALVNAQGARLVDKKGKADAVVAIRSGALSVGRSQFLLGVAKLMMPVPFGGAVETPELALLKKVARSGIAKLGVHAYEQTTGKHLLSIGPVSGKAHYNLWTILAVTFAVTNTPEK